MTPPRRRFSAPLIALLAAATLFALFAVNLMTLATIHASRRLTARARRAQNLLSTIRATALDAESGQRGFLLTGRAEYLEPVDEAVASLPSSLADLGGLLADDPEQREQVRELAALSTAKLEELRRAISLYRRGEAVADVRSIDDKALTDRIRRVIAEMRVHEDAQLEARGSAARRRLDRAIWIDGGAGIGLLALGFVLFLINRDIARREQLERALRESAAFQEQFVGILGHDLRNPLAAIAMAVQRVQKLGAPEALAGAVGQIGSAAERMRRMVDQLLDLTRARLAGGIPVQLRPNTDLAAVAEDVVGELRSASPGAELRFDARGPVLGAWDPDRLAQLISNLVGNAIVHGVGPVAIRVRGDDELALLQVHNANAGSPISGDLLPWLFQPFHGAADRGPAPSPRGLGLGLFIVERIVAAHGGTVRVRSTDSDGTTFTVELPLLPDNSLRSQRGLDPAQHALHVFVDVLGQHQRGRPAG
jgi:signal transduction histidine kinase